MDRRDFLTGAAAAATAWAAKDVAFPTEASAQAAPPPETGDATLVAPRAVGQHRGPDRCPTRMARASRSVKPSWRAGIAAVDLTVRDDGHVRPPLVATNLPLMLHGIRSTGAICTMIGTNFGPPSDPTNTAWIASQFVHEILSVAGANGITKYRYNNAGNTVPSFPANTFGQQMTTLLDGVRVNHRRLAAINAQYGRHAGRRPYALAAISARRWSRMPIRCRASTPADRHQFRDGPRGDAAAGVTGRSCCVAAMPYIRHGASRIWTATVNATTGALSISNVQPPGATGTGGGVINWATFYSLLRLGGYSGFAESQLEYTITGGTGTSVSLNNAVFADSAQFTSGQLTPAIMLAEFKIELRLHPGARSRRRMDRRRRSSER